MTESFLAAGFVGTEPLPPACHNFKRTEFKKYRDAVCRTFNLHFKAIGGNGNCFFDSVSNLLSSDHNPSTIRNDVIRFLRSCFNGYHDVFGERCAMYMNDELGKDLVSEGSRRVNVVPRTVAEYLDASACNGVWVEGYHWLLAVSWLYQVCVCVVIHGHEYLHLFGNTDHPRIHLYKREGLTHYDALPDGRPDVPEVAQLRNPVAAFSDPAEAKRNEIMKERSAILARIEEDKNERRLKSNRQVTARAPHQRE
jgi:hypothetical protein